MTLGLLRRFTPRNDGGIASELDAPRSDEEILCRKKHSSGLTSTGCQLSLA